MKLFLFTQFILQSIFLFGQDSIRIIGHRGCRGLLPENSIISFQKALALGADGIELDVIVNKDKQLVVSHEPYFQSSFCLDSVGNSIRNEGTFNMYELTQEQIRKFDCGSIGHPKFPMQEKIVSTKPLFSEFLSQVDMAGKTLLFEVKSSDGEYGRSQPYPEEYVSIILNEISRIPASVDLMIMSFDRNLLEELHERSPEYRLVYLTYLPVKGIRSFLKDLTFKPYALGMFYPTVKKRKVHRLRASGVRIFSWTVNDEKKATRLIRKGVELIITDYPDQLIKIANARS